MADVHSDLFRFRGLPVEWAEIPEQCLFVGESFSLDLETYLSAPSDASVTLKGGTSLPSGVTLSGLSVSGTPISVGTDIYFTPIFVATVGSISEETEVDMAVLNADLRGDVLATSGTFTAGDSYGQLEHTWTVESGAPNGVNLFNSQLNLPSLPPSRYMGFWAVLEINSAEEDAVLLPWGNTYPNIVTGTRGGQYPAVLIDADPDRLIGYDGTTESSARSFNLIADNSSPSGITFYDNKYWILDGDDEVYVYSTAGAHDSASSFDTLLSFDWAGITHYNNRLLLMTQTSNPVRLYYFNPTTGVQIGDSFVGLGNIAAATGVTAFNGYMYAVGQSDRSLYYWTLSDSFALGARQSVPLPTAIGNPQGMSNDGSNLVIIDFSDNGYYSVPINANGSPDFSARTFTNLSTPDVERGIAISNDSAIPTVDVFTLENNHTKYKRLSSDEEFIDVHFVREDDGQVRLVLASTTDALPDDAVVKLYPAAI